MDYHIVALLLFAMFASQAQAGKRSQNLAHSYSEEEINTAKHNCIQDIQNKIKKGEHCSILKKKFKIKLTKEEIKGIVADMKQEKHDHKVDDHKNTKKGVKMAKKCKSAENVEFCQGIVAELDVLKKQCIVDKKTYSGYGQPDSCIEMKGRKKDFLQNSGRMTQTNFWSKSEAKQTREDGLRQSARPGLLSNIPNGMFADSIVPDYEYDGPKSPTITQRSSEETSAEISDLAQLKLKCKQSKDGFKNRKIKTIECQKYSAALAKDSNFIQKNVNKIQDNQPVHYGSKDDPTFHCGNLIEGGFTELSLDECVLFFVDLAKSRNGCKEAKQNGVNPNDSEHCLRYKELQKDIPDEGRK